MDHSVTSNCPQSRELFAEQATILEGRGVDLTAETFYDLGESRRRSPP
jgi:hypothetical protein